MIVEYKSTNHKKEKPMNKLTYRFLMTFIAYSILIVPFLLMGYTTSHAEKSAESKAVFYVKWYGVGKSALEGLKGVKRVENGFLKHKEINRVYYDPGIISIRKMRTALENAGTFLGMAE